MRKPPTHGGLVPKKMRKDSKYNIHGYMIEPEYMDEVTAGEVETYHPLTFGAGALVTSFMSQKQVTMKKLDEMKASGKIPEIVTKADKKADAKVFDCGKVIKLHPMLKKMLKNKLKDGAQAGALFSEKHSDLDLEMAQAELAQTTAKIDAEKAAAKIAAGKAAAART
jgi:hypothetical protein